MMTLEQIKKEINDLQAWNDAYKECGSNSTVTAQDKAIYRDWINYNEMKIGILNQVIGEH